MPLEWGGVRGGRTQLYAEPACRGTAVQTLAFPDHGERELHAVGGLIKGVSESDLQGADP
eukprot:362754-Chlamydomonas_euryale.AAC.17